MRRAFVVLSAVLTIGITSPAATASVKVRTDPNDSASPLDIRTVITNLSRTTMYLRLGSWERFRIGDMQETWGFALDTVGGHKIDRWVGIYPVRNGVRCDVRGGPHGFDLIGTRHATRPDRRSIACHLPRGWFGHIRRAIRFRAFIQEPSSKAAADDAPDLGFYRWN